MNTMNTVNTIREQLPPAPAPERLPYTSAGERYLATAIPGLFNLTVGFLVLKDFVHFQEVYGSNVRCRKHWPQLTRYVHRADSHLFSVFYSKAALRWVLFKGIDARNWRLRLGKLGHNHSFLHVCQDGDLDLVRAMGERTQVDLELRDIRGRTPLQWAAHNGRLPVVQYLCEQGADKEARDSWGRTPLHMAKGHTAVVDFLRGGI